MSAPLSQERAGILVVDDRPDKHVVYRAILEELGQDLVEATSGEQALKHVLHRDFAVILLDVNMPGLDGLDTAALIRGRKRSAHVPIIFVTADYGDEIRTARGYSLGAVDFMMSPIVPEVLRTKVKVFVDLYLLARQAKRQAEESAALAAERIARDSAERASRQSAFLADASAALSGSLIASATTRALARLAVPFLADVSALTLVEAEGVEPVTELAWTDPEAPSGIATEALQTTAWLGWRHAVERVITSGKLETFTPSHVLPITAGAGSGSPMVLPRGPQITALALVPLIARARTIGVLSLGMGPSERAFDSELLDVATDLAGRAAIALDNAFLYRTLHEQDRRKNEFLAMLSHELRNPLAPITNAAHMLQPNETDPRRITWAKEVISRQVRQLARLVDDLLDVSRITQGKIELKIESIEVSEVVNAAVETARPMLDSQEHALAVVLPAQPLRIKGDFTRLAQVLGNLLNNAAKYTDRNGRIELTVGHEESQIVFRVRDSGIGIPPDALGTIFELFAQVQQTLDRSRGGLGIGLTLVKRLVEMQGGTVAAHSEGYGCGSEFVVRLPEAIDAAPTKTSLTQSKPGGESVDASYRVLVVDDNVDAAESMAMILRLDGYVVQLAFDGEVALDAVRNLAPDAILLDIGLPRMDGFQVAERIRALPSCASTLLVAITGYGQPEDLERSRRAGFDRHIVKPIDPSLLTQMLAEHCRSRTTVNSTENVVPLRKRPAAN